MIAQNKIKKNKLWLVQIRYQLLQLGLIVADVLMLMQLADNAALSLPVVFDTVARANFIDAHNEQPVAR